MVAILAMAAYLPSTCIIQTTLHLVCITCIFTSFRSVYHNLIRFKEAYLILMMFLMGKYGHFRKKPTIAQLGKIQSASISKF